MRQQYMLNLEELENNEAFRNNRFSSENPHLINSTGGPQKTVVQWKRIFTDWRSSVKKKARIIQMERNQTGRGSSEKPFTNIEENLINAIGNIVVNVNGYSRKQSTATTSSDIVPSCDTRSSCKASRMEMQADSCGSDRTRIQACRTNGTLLSSISLILDQSTVTEDNN